MKFLGRFPGQINIFCALLLFSNCARHAEPPKTEPNPGLANTSEPSNMSPRPSEPASNATPPPQPSSPNQTPPSTPAAAAGGPALRILVLKGHAPDWLVAAAETKLGGKVEVTTYATAAEFRTILSKPEQKFDLVGVTDRLIPELIKNQTLAPWPKVLSDELPRSQPLYLHHYFDEENFYTQPYGCSLLGYSYPSDTPALKVAKATPANAAKEGAHPKDPVVTIAPGPTGWKDLDKLIPQISWPEDEELRAAVQHFYPEPAKAADAKSPTLTNVSVEFITYLKNPPKTPAPPSAVAPNEPTPASTSATTIVLPVEGTLILIYHWAIIKDTPHLEAAQNYLRVACSAENAAHLSVDNYYAVTQTAALKALPPEVVNDKLLYPPDDKQRKNRNPLLDHCEFIRAKP